jgi:hypothetical protein
MAKLVSLLLLCLGMVFAPAVGLSGPSRATHSTDSIQRLVENRGGRVSCWGVVIRLGNSRFREVIRPEQIVIREAKHGHDLMGMMSWHVGRNGKRLMIKFKPGAGDFGSGNSIGVRVDRSALLGVSESGNNPLEWSINTDVH